MTSTLSATELWVLSRWGIQSVVAASIPSMGVVNRTVLIQTEHNGYALRVYAPQKSREAIELEHRVMSHAWFRGVPAILPLPLPVGGYYLEHEGFFYALFPQAMGNQVAREDLQPTHLITMGRSLALLNTALADFPPEGLPQRNFAKTVPETIATIDRLLAVIALWPTPSAQEDNAIMCLEQQREYLRRRSPQFSPGGIAFQPTHGDFHEGNIFFQEDRIVGIIDWDQVRMGAKAWEAIRYANFLYLHHPPSLIRLFLESFFQHSDLSLDEFERTVQLYSAHHAHDIWAMQAYYLESNEKAAVFISPLFVPFEERWRKIGFKPQQ